MALPNIFSPKVTQELIGRIEMLTASTQPKWGKMSVAQMLAHCNVSYEMTYDNIHPKPNAFLKLILKLFVKKGVVDETPYKRNTRTAPAFLITEPKNFETEKHRLISYLERTQRLGENEFDNRESMSFGKMSKVEWNNMFYKHLDHHLAQFGV